MLPFVNYILCSYAYLAIGILLTLVNIPIFLLVIMNKVLRETYIVLAVVFLNSGFAGISIMSLGIKRLIISIDGEEFIDHYECVLNMSILILTAYLLDGLGLLMNSIERLSIVAFPIYYYTHNKRIKYSLIITQYVITIIAITSTVVASLIEPIRRISNFCLLRTVYSWAFYSILKLMASVASLLSVILMVIVVIILRKKFGIQYLSNHSYNRDLSHFLKNQKRYTQTSLVSCCFTFFFVLVPSILEDIYILDNSKKPRIILTSCMFLHFLNSFNMAVLFLYRQRDFRYAAIHCFKYLLYKRKQHVQPMVVVGFGK